MTKKMILGILVVACIGGSLLLVPNGNMFAADNGWRPVDYRGQYNWTVEISGVAAGSFKEVSGIGTEVAVVEYQDGNDLVLRKRPGRSSCSDVTLKRGYVDTEDLWEWWLKVKQGEYVRRDISIVLSDNTGQEIRRWNLIDCWPKSWKFGDLSGMEVAENAVEEITFVVEDLELDF